jgi:thioesterase domain-containing protein
MLGVEEITGQWLPYATFLAEPTFSGLCQAVRAKLKGTQFQPVMALRKHGTRPPLFCFYIHDGEINWCFDLAEALGDDQPVFGIRSPALADPSRLSASIEAAAAEAIRYIRKIQPEGAPALVGYSWGNLLAFEVARQLAENEGISCCTNLIGSDAPMRPANSGTRIAHFVRHFPAWVFDCVRDEKNRKRRLAIWRHRLTHQKFGKAHLPFVSSPLSHHMIALMEKYSPPPDSGVSINLFRERHAYHSQPHPLRAWEQNYLSDAGWQQWAGQPVRVQWLEGDHETMIRPPLVSALAQSIRQAMDGPGKKPVHCLTVARERALVCPA